MKKRILVLLMCICLMASLAVFVPAGAEASSSDGDNAVVLDKTVDETGEESFEITLEAYATGEEVPAPVDVVFVVDQSTSMFSTLNTNLTEFTGYSYSQFKNFLNTGNNKSLVEQEGYFVVRINDEARYFNATTAPDCSEYYSTIDDYNAAYSANGNNSSFTDVFHVVGKSVTKLGNILTNYRRTNVNYPAYSDGVADYIWLPVRWNSAKNRLEYNVTVLESTRTQDASGNPINNGSIGGAEYYDDATGKYWLPFPECADGINSTNMRFYQTIYGATYDAMMLFYNNTKNIENCNVAIVGFSEGGGIFGATSTNAYNEDLNMGVTGKLSAAAVDDLTGTLQAVRANYGSGAFAEVGSTTLLNRIKNINPNYYGTITDAGLGIANYIFKNGNITGARSDAKRFVILYTDGDPVGTMRHLYDATGTQETTQGILQAYKLKDTYDATIFSIAPPSNVNSTYLSCISSEYPQAKSTSDKGAKNPNGVDYAIAANSNAELVAAFATLSETIAQTQIDLGKTAVLKDIISDSFRLPDGSSEADIKVYTAPYDGTDFGELQEFTDAEIEIDGKDISVTNFDYAGNFVSSVPRNGYYGCKLVVKIPIVPNPDFLGGDEVPTNTDGSGIYSGDTLIGKFPVPDVDITVSEIIPKFKDGSIYVSQAAEIPHIANIGHYEIDGVSYTIDGINNDFVDIKYTISDGTNSISTTIPAGSKMADLDDLVWTSDGTLAADQVLTEDTQYTVTCDVISINNREENNSQASGTPTIYVYKPEITFKDSSMNLGTTADYDVNNYGEWIHADVDEEKLHIVWTHGSGEQKKLADPDVMGAAPTLEFTFNPVEAAFTTETNVSVTSVTAQKDVTGNLKHDVPENRNIIDYTTFYREACTFGDCDHTTDNHVAVNAGKTQVNFVVHLNRFDLQINKTVTGNYVDPDQTFIFRITGPNNFSIDVAVEAGTPVTIKSLPAGVYTVRELTDWSWRYDVVGSAAKEVSSASVNADGLASVSFENERERIYWLSGETVVKNLFNGVNPNPTPVDPANPQS